MSTRTNIHFNHGKTVCANIYRHSDGYPGKVVDGREAEYGVLPDLLKFFGELLENVPDGRFGHAEYLAAKFLVWQAKEYAVNHAYDAKSGEWTETPKHHLDFLSVGVCMEDHGDIEFVYELDCDDLDAKGCPAVRWKPYGGRFRKVYLHGAPKAKSKKSGPRTIAGRNGATITVTEV